MYVMDECGSDGSVCVGVGVGVGVVCVGVCGCVGVGVGVGVVCVGVGVLFHIPFHYRLLQDTKHSFLCYLVGPCCLFYI